MHNSENLGSGSANSRAYEGIEELILIEGALKNYNFNIIKRFKQGLGLVGNHAEVGLTVDFGAGLGTLAQLWNDEFSSTVTCVEVDPKLRNILTSKGYPVLSSISESKRNFTICFTSNVLEHIEDDVGALREIRMRLEPNAKIAIHVPALPRLYSHVDKRIGHFRRYEKNDLIERVERAGFQVIGCYYNDCIGAVVWGLIKIMGSSKFLEPNALLLSLYDKYIFPFSNILDRVLFKHIVGKNLFIFANVAENQ
jgi:SAM-dependent methyltransferase